MRSNNVISSFVFNVFFMMAVYCCFTSAGDIPWNLEKFRNAPDYFPAKGFGDYCPDGINAIFFEGPEYKGNDTQLFAYLGIPEDLSDKIPAMVLIHGGGGTADPDWVKLWNDRGYAAISIDTTGSVPNGEFPTHKKHSLGGPDGWGGFSQIDEKIEDQWTYHAVAAAILGNSILAADFNVDRNKIGVTGVSWGGYLTCIAASVDERFAFAAPIYGCGFLHEDSAWSDTIFNEMDKEKTDKWVKLWDPSSYLELCDVPVLWVNGINDRFFPLSSFLKSCSLVYESQLCIKPDLGHSQKDAVLVEEVYAFADSICKSGEKMVSFLAEQVEGETAMVRLGYSTSLETVELLYTKDTGPWKDRKWQSIPAEVDPVLSVVKATVHEGTNAYFFNATNDKGLISSSKYVSEQED